MRSLAPIFDVDPNYASCIVAHESEWNPNAVGDDGQAVGLWQWHLDSWEYVRKRMGKDTTDLRADPFASSMTALFAIGRLDLGSWWTSSQTCLCVQEGDLHFEEVKK